MMIKGISPVVYSWVSSLLSVFSRKFQFWATFWRFRGINGSLVSNMSYKPKKTHPCVTSHLLSYCAWKSI